MQLENEAAHKVPKQILASFETDLADHKVDDAGMTVDSKMDHNDLSKVAPPDLDRKPAAGLRRDRRELPLHDQRQVSQRQSQVPHLCPQS